MQQGTWGFPRLAHQDPLDEFGGLEDRLHLPEGEPAAAEPGWMPSCRGPIAAISRFPAPDPASAVMSSASGSSTSSVCSDGRKRKDSPLDLAAASKRYRHHDPLCLTSVSSVCTAAGSILTQIEEAAGLQWSTSSVSCVADATDQGNTCGASTTRCTSDKCKSPKAKHASYRLIGGASCDATAGERLCRATRCQTQDDTRQGSDSESDEDVTSSDPDRRQTMERGRKFVSQTVASKKRKVDKCDVEDDVPLDCCTRETPSSLEEEDADSCAQTVSTKDVKVATSNPDDESRSPPFFVLSSGRLSKGEEKRRGKRPPTVDDEFDRYLANLIL